MYTPSLDNPDLDQIFATLENDPSTAENQCNAFLEKNPNSDLALLLKFLACRRQGKFMDALNIAQRRIEINPNNDSAYLDVSEMSYHFGDYGNAITSAQKAIEFDDDRTLGGIPYRIAALGYAQLGNLPQALRYADLAGKIDPDHWATAAGNFVGQTKAEFVSKLRNLS
jgi:tetratricopeptide (TPR) repeat protein